MASTATLSPDAAGLVASEILMEAFFEAPTFDLLYVNYLTKNKATVRKGQLDAILKPYNCTFTSQDNTLLVEPIVMIPVRCEVADEFCNSDFTDDYESYKLRPGVENDEVTYTDFIVDIYKKSTSEQLEIAAWQASTAGSDGTILSEFEGYLAKMLASSDTEQIDAAAVTATNVLAELDKIYDAIPYEIVDSPDLVIAVSNNIWGAAQKAWRSQGMNTSDMTATFAHNGIPLVKLPGLPANTASAFRKNNLMWASDVLQSEVFIKNMFDVNLDNNTRFKLVTSLDVALGIESEIVIYSPDVA